MGFPGGSVVKNPPANAGVAGSIPAPVFSPTASHGQRNLLGYSTWGPKVRYDLATKHTKKCSFLCGSHYTSVGQYCFNQRSVP